MRRLAALVLLAAGLAGCGAAGHALGLALEASRPLLRALPDGSGSRCATDLVRRPDGTWWRCGQLESTAAELAEAAADAEPAAYWP